ncbi:SDR family NAD(P)-dependent oxidoreductase [Streptomyces sp. NPDC058255]|uniref:SDR family NAD(P)-dependent oxidoreductase n=1 Tax=Streptomyces sp. NPDC058255 TaxID=3346407 RepID=UPI0036E0F298
MNDRPVALITGSSSGIGAATARRFAAAGMRVVVNSASSVESGEKLAAELPDAVYVQGDVSDAADARHIVDAAIAAYGRLDVLVNNAGTTRFIPLDDLDAVDADTWRAILDINVIGTWQVTAAAVPHLKASGSAAVINISSVSGSRALGSSIPYGVSKAAVNHLTRMLAATLGPEIRVNALAPGLIETPWYDEAPKVLEDSREWVAAHTPLRRAGTPEDVAEAALALVRATYTTGDVLSLDGGRHVV